MDPALVSVLGCLAGRGAQVDPAYLTATFRGTFRIRSFPVILVSQPRLVSSSRLPLSRGSSQRAQACRRVFSRSPPR
eukprot:11212282-Alexandrium_andersonii.AAC.1